MGNPSISPQLRSDVYKILMRDDYEPPYVSNIQPTNVPRSGYYFIDVKFKGIDLSTTDGFEIEITPTQIVAWDAKQDFSGSWTDEHTLKVTLASRDYLRLVNNYHNLVCHIDIYPYDDRTDTKDTIPLKSFDFQAFLKNASDIRKTINTNTLSAADETRAEAIPQLIPAEFQLIEIDIYEYTRNKLRTILTNTTVEKAICFLASKYFKVPNVFIMPPDNKTTYTNFIIPPMLNLVEILEHIDKYYGIYNEGVGFYLTNKTLFVYPKFNTKKPSVFSTVHLYHAGEKFPDGTKYHVYSNNDLHIVVSALDNVLAIQDSVVEKVGTRQIVLDTDSIMDECFMYEPTHDNTLINRLGIGEAILNPNKVVVYHPETEDIGFNQRTVVPQYRVNWNNMYKINELVNSIRCNILLLEWKSAEPFSIFPGSTVKYHYDSDVYRDRMRDKSVSEQVYRYCETTGSIASMVYIIRPIMLKSGKQLFNCISRLMCYIEPDVKRLATDKQVKSLSNPDLGILTFNEEESKQEQNG